MKRAYFCLFCIVLLSGAVWSQEDQIVPITDFEVDNPELTGGCVTFAMIDSPAAFDAPALDGEWAMFGEYDNASNQWSQTQLRFETPVDLTGMREIRMSIYFMEETTTDANGYVRIRLHNSMGDCMGFYYVPPGEWFEMTYEIDPYMSDNEFDAVSQIRLIISAGVVGTGSFFIDNVYAVRPAGTQDLEIVPLYGFNETNPGDDSPLGWTDEVEHPILAGDWGEPSEGSDCMLLPVTGNIYNSKTLHAKEDFDWSRVRAIYFDVKVTEDFSPWGVIRPYIESSSGGRVQEQPYRSINSFKTEWRPVSFSIDLSSHMPAILSEDGEFSIGFYTNCGADAHVADGQHYLVDNFRVGILQDYAMGSRTIAQEALYQGQQGDFDVQLHIVLKSDNDQAVVVQESIPEGWSTSAISDGGVLADGVIEWTVDMTANQSLDLSYTATSSGDPQEAPLWSGNVNGEPTYGDETVLFVNELLTQSLVEAPYMNKTPELDGVINEGEYAGANRYDMNHDTSDGNVPPGVHLFGNEYPADQEYASFYVFHNTEYIYVAVDATDPSLYFTPPDPTRYWESDSPEVYMDGNMTRQSSREGNPYGFQATVIGDGSVAAVYPYQNPVEDLANGAKACLEGKASEDGVIFWGCAAKEKDDGSGYVVEYRFEKSQILDPVERTLLGFDIEFNCGEAGSEGRTGKWGWFSTGEDGVPIESPSQENRWGLLQLLDSGTAVSDWNLY